MGFMANATLVLNVETAAQTVEVPRIVDLSGNSPPIQRNSHALIHNAHASHITYVRVNHNDGDVEAATTAVGGYDYAIPGVSELTIPLGAATQLSFIASAPNTAVYVQWGKDM